MGAVAYGVVSAVVAIGGAVADIIGGRKSREEAEKAREERLERLRKAGNLSLAEAAATTRAKLFEQRVQIGTSIEDIVQESLREAGIVRVSGAASGVSGRSVDEAQLEVETEAAQGRSRLHTLRGFQEASAEQRLRQHKLEIEARLAAEAPIPEFNSNAWAEGLSIVSAGLSGYAAGLRLGNASVSQEPKTR